MSQSRKFIFTVNNYKNVLSVLPEKLNYICYGPEVGEEGTPHIQGYCEFHTKRRQNGAKEYIDTLFGNGCWCKAMSKKATTEDNIGYTSGMCEKKGFKLNPDWVEFGERMKQGDRTDLEEFRDEVRGGMSLYNAYENHISIMARYPYLYTAIQSVTPPHNDKPIVKLYWGRSGTGKTTLALSEGCIEVTYDGRYFSGCHDKMVINELHPNQFDRSLFLRITDEYPTPVRLLGSYAQWHPKLLIFTSNFSPDNLFSLDEAYLRRFAEMRHFESPYW